MNFKIVFLVLCAWFVLSKSVGQERKLRNEELENFVIQTDQDFYLAGDRVWFAAKLLKNHESYRYSKLAYLVVLDASAKPIHHEKMLLTGQDMVFGDFFISESIQSGVFSIVMYTSWMSNFEDFPVAKKEFLAVNPSSPKPAGEPVLFWEQIPFENTPVSVFHTSSQAEVIEIQDQSGQTLEILEAVPPLQKVLSTVKPLEAYRLVFRNRDYLVAAQKWHWNPADFSLSSKASLSPNDFRIITHTDWKILEEIEIGGEMALLNKALYQKLNSFKISVLDANEKVVWSYQVQLVAKNSGQLQLSSRGKVGEEMKVDLTGFSPEIGSGVIMASREEDPQVLDLVEVLNHPNWMNLNSKTQKPNLISALQNEVENPLLLKEYSPMYDYKSWSTDIKVRFKNSTQPAGLSFSLGEPILQEMVNRKMYQGHFEVTEAVVALQSPFAADKVFYLEDYEEFPDLESLIKEIVPQVRLRKSNSGTSKEIYIANTDDEHVKFNKKPLILVDFYRPLSMDEVWKLDMSSLDRIELYYHRRTVETTNLGEAVGDGLIVFYTKNNEYFLKNNLPKEQYFLSDVSVPRRPDYSNKSRMAVSANPLQFMDAGLTFDRGKSKTGNLVFDTAGSWLVGAWLFGNEDFEKVQKRIQIDP